MCTMRKLYCLSVLFVLASVFQAEAFTAGAGAGGWRSGKRGTVDKQVRYLKNQCNTGNLEKF